MFNLPCVILAGGKSSRMGKDKSLLPFKGHKTLTEYQLSRLSPLFKSVHVSIKDDKFDFEADFIKDSGEVYSPMVALGKILSHFKTSHVFILSVDAPFVSDREIKKLFLHINNFHIIIPQTPSHKHPLCGFYATSLAKKCEELAKKDMHKIGLLKDFAKVKYVKFENETPFTNLNYMDEYEKALLKL